MGRPWSKRGDLNEVLKDDSQGVVDKIKGQVLFEGKK